MAVSTRPLDKFAFLYAGENNDQYKADLRKVLETLIIWYGYLPEHVCVRVPFPVSNLTDPVFLLTGLDIDEISGADAGELKTSLQTELEVFIDTAKIKDSGLLPGELNTTFFYFTGAGRVNPATSRFELQIGLPGGSAAYVDGLWLKNRIYGYDTLLRDNSYIHILMQQSYGYGMWQDVFSLIADPVLRLTFTAACNSGAVNPPNTAGSDFTDYWTKALQFEQRDRTGSGDFIYADQENTGGAEPVDNLLISLKKAYLFADAFTHTSTEPQYQVVVPSGDPSDQYLGLPSFWIRDGDEPIPPETSDYWWESKDIFLTHPDNADPDAPDDLYHANTINHIHIIIRNNGTHPVREFYSGTIVFLTGGGGVGDSVVHIVNVSLKPGEAYEHVYDYFFGGTEVHRCIKSRASLEEITVNQLDENGVDDIAWLVADRSNEAQRNLDPLPVSGKSSTGTGNAIPDPGKGQADETNPEEEAAPPVDGNGNNVQPEGTTESKSTSNLRNFREHAVVIRNIFKRKKKFIVAFPEDFKKVMKYCRLEWYVRPEKNGKYRLLKPVDGESPYLEFDLKGGESREFIIYSSLKPGKLHNFNLKIPFEILVDTVSVKDELAKLLKGVVRKADLPDFMPFSGFTIEFSRAEGATLYGTVYDAKRKPLPGVLVYIYSGDRYQSAIMKTNKYGSFCVRDINPGNYILRAGIKGKANGEAIIYIGEGETARVDFFQTGKEAPDKKVKKPAAVKRKRK